MAFLKCGKRNISSWLPWKQGMDNKLLEVLSCALALVAHNLCEEEYYYTLTDTWMGKYVWESVPQTTEHIPAEGLQRQQEDGKSWGVPKDYEEGTLKWGLVWEIERQISGETAFVTENSMQSRAHTYHLGALVTARPTLAPFCGPINP